MKEASPSLVEMIIPIRCKNCGKPLADVYRFYQRELRRLKGNEADKRFYMDGTTVPDTPERKILDQLGLKRACCRKDLLTQVDLMDKI